MKFHGTSSGLNVEVGRKIEWLISARFMQRENQTKFGDYMRQISSQLNEMGLNDTESFSDEVRDILVDAKDKVRSAKLAENYLEEVSF